MGLSQDQLSLNEMSGIDIAGVVWLEVAKHRAGDIQLRQPKVKSGELKLWAEDVSLGACKIKMKVFLTQVTTSYCL